MSSQIYKSMYLGFWRDVSMPIQIIPTNSIRTILAYWLKCTCWCQSRVYLPTIPEEQRQDEQAFWETFTQAHPLILGAVLDIVSTALRTLPTVQLVQKPRMADFALWACAAAEACGWTDEEFLEASQGMRETAHGLTLDASLVGPFVRDFAGQHREWEGTASELLTALETLAHGGVTTGGVTMQAPKVGSDVTKQKGWPKNGRALSNALRRLAPTLRVLGIAVTFDREPDAQRRRIIRLTQSMSQAPPAHQTSGAEGEAEDRERELL